VTFFFFRHDRAVHSVQRSSARCSLTFWIAGSARRWRRAARIPGSGEFGLRPLAPVAHGAGRRRRSSAPTRRRLHPGFFLVARPGRARRIRPGAVPPREVPLRDIGHQPPPTSVTDSRCQDHADFGGHGWETAIRAPDAWANPVSGGASIAHAGPTCRLDVGPSLWALLRINRYQQALGIARITDIAGAVRNSLTRSSNPPWIAWSAGGYAPTRRSTGFGSPRPVRGKSTSSRRCLQGWVIGQGFSRSPNFQGPDPTGLKSRLRSTGSLNRIVAQPDWGRAVPGSLPRKLPLGLPAMSFRRTASPWRRVAETAGTRSLSLVRHQKLVKASERGTTPNSGQAVNDLGRAGQRRWAPSRSAKGPALKTRWGRVPRPSR